MNRRNFLRLAGAAAIGGALDRSFASAMTAEPATASSEPSSRQLPRWRGFNLLEKFGHQHKAAFRESDFDLIAKWGFDFVRLPLSYRCWASEEKPREMNEKELADVDEAVRLCRQRRIHVNVNFHRIPGYCVNPPKETRSIWTDESVLDDAAWMWGAFAKRYKGIPSSAVSFDLMNEPPDVPEEQYVKVVTRLTQAIHAEDPDRLVIADGLKWGKSPVMGLIGANVAQSTRGYQPFHLTHYQASWVEGSDKWAIPTWPMVEVDEKAGTSTTWDAAEIRRSCVAPWIALRSQGVGIHVGEWGAHNRTPHDVVLKWMHDLLAEWKREQIGWALWNLRGSFGVLDS